MNQTNDFIHTGIDAFARKQLRENWRWFLWLGIGLIVFGSLAVTFSLVSTIISMEYLGFILEAIGFFEAVKAFKMSRWSGFFLHLFLAILYMVGGIFMIANPQANAITLTLLIAIFFIVSGVLRIIFAYAKQVPHPEWLVFNGALSIFLGILIWLQWPASGLWVLGTLLGIDMVFTGWTWVMLAMRAKNLHVE